MSRLIFFFSFPKDIPTTFCNPIPHELQWLLQYEHVSHGERNKGGQNLSLNLLGDLGCGLLLSTA